MQVLRIRCRLFTGWCMRKRREMLCAVFLCAAMHDCASFAAADKNALSRSIETLTQEQIKNYKIPGLAIAVTLENRVVYSGSYGWADLEGGVRVTSKTLFRIGSITKPITATTAMMLAEQRHLDLDLPVERYCAPFPQKPWRVTTRDLLGHLAGVRGFGPGSTSSPELLSNTHYDQLKDTLALFANDPLVAEPRTRYEYSNYGYDLIGCVLEGASEKTFEDL